MHIAAGPALAATQDDDFLAARDAFRAGDAGRFERAAKSLADYPLEPYIAYWRLRLRLEQASPDDVQALLARVALRLALLFPVAPQLAVRRQQLRHGWNKTQT